MVKLPMKGSTIWYYVWAASFVGNTILLLSTRILLGQTITAQNILGFSIIAFLITLFLVPGYFGLKILPLGVMVGNTAGIGYMLYLILTNKNDGWIDLTSIFGFLSLVVFGLLAGVIAQIGIAISRRKK